LLEGTISDGKKGKKDLTEEEKIRKRVDRGNKQGTGKRSA